MLKNPSAVKAVDSNNKPAAKDENKKSSEKNLSAVLVVYDIPSNYKRPKGVQRVEGQLIRAMLMCCGFRANLSAYICSWTGFCKVLPSFQQACEIRQVSWKMVRFDPSESDKILNMAKESLLEQIDDMMMLYAARVKEWERQIKESAREEDKEHAKSRIQSLKKSVVRQMQIMKSAIVEFGLGDLQKVWEAKKAELKLDELFKDAERKSDVFQKKLLAKFEQKKEEKK